MKSVEFCYWLQGMFELSNPAELTKHQTDMIKRHLAMVFVHEIDPSYPSDQQAALDKAHAKPDFSNPSPIQATIPETDWLMQNGGRTEKFIARC